MSEIPLNGFEQFLNGLVRYRGYTFERLIYSNTDKGCLLFEGFDMDVGRRVALKVLATNSNSLHETIEREIELMQRLQDSAHVVPLLEYFYVEEIHTYVLVLPLC